MPPLDESHFAILTRALDSDFVPHLPPLLDLSKPLEEQQRKNRSRAFGAFALRSICGIPAVEAAHSVVDDFDDYGVDAIYYHAPQETLYLVQSKLKAAEQFSQDEALAFCQGIRKLIKQDFTGFNQNVQKRTAEIEDALDNCSHIVLVVAHTGAGISNHAKEALEELIADEDHGEEQLASQPIDYDAATVLADLRAGQAYEKVNETLTVQNCRSVTQPRITYFGLMHLEDLVSLHQKYGRALYERNIRTFLGHKTDVNIAIRQTLEARPAEFVYLNNGVTALCELIEAKSTKGERKKLKVRGLSVINGAQTIASSAKFTSDKAGADISAAKVFFTLIKASTDADFGKAVTRARNFQNPVLFADFVALDDEQERLRRELAYLGIHYAFKPGAVDAISDINHFRVDEAAQALSLFQVDPRYPVWLKKEPGQLLNSDSSQYKALFGPTVSAFYVANAVRFNRYVMKRTAAEAQHATGLERLVYKHGNYALSWILAKRVKDAVASAQLIDEKKVAAQLSAPFDQLRQTLWQKTEPLVKGDRGPLAFFGRQTDVVPLLEPVAIEDYGLTADPVVDHKRKQYKSGQPYPEALFLYLASKAPQIGNLT